MVDYQQYRQLEHFHRVPYQFRFQFRWDHHFHQDRRFQQDFHLNHHQKKNLHHSLLQTNDQEMNHYLNHHRTVEEFFVADQQTHTPFVSMSFY